MGSTIGTDLKKSPATFKTLILLQKISGPHAMKDTNGAKVIDELRPSANDCIVVADTSPLMELP
ncbi:MAG: hypothetical protein WAM14_07045 [Candidatus Nitrosopolaris sp.]